MAISLVAAAQADACKYVPQPRRRSSFCTHNLPRYAECTCACSLNICVPIFNILTSLVACNVRATYNVVVDQRGMIRIRRQRQRRKETRGRGLSRQQLLCSRGDMLRFCRHSTTAYVHMQCSVLISNQTQRWDGSDVYMCGKTPMKSDACVRCIQWVRAAAVRHDDSAAQCCIEHQRREAGSRHLHTSMSYTS